MDDHLGNPSCFDYIMPYFMSEKADNSRQKIFAVLQVGRMQDVWRQGERDVAGDFACGGNEGEKHGQTYTLSSRALCPVSLRPAPEGRP
jgi:hypothetical protein